MTTLSQAEKTTTVNIRCTPQFKRALRRAAADRDQTIEQVVTEAVTERLGFQAEDAKAKRTA